MRGASVLGLEPRKVGAWTSNGFPRLSAPRPFCWCALLYFLGSLVWSVKYARSLRVHERTYWWAWGQLYAPWCQPMGSLRYWVRTWCWRSEEHTSELQSRGHLVCRLLL